MLSPVCCQDLSDESQEISVTSEGPLLDIDGPSQVSLTGSRFEP